MPYRFDSLRDVEAHLASRTDYEKMARFAYHERAFDLGRMERLLEALGNPQDRFPSVHVAGTKGKGSVCHMTASALSAAGLKTGLFTSPHLVSLLERVRIGSASVDESAFCRGMDRVADAADASVRPGEETPTFFERIFALALHLFSEAGVDAAVIEVGLGGRLDATNVIRPRACAITRLALDHTQVLGSTLCAIAREKAGILKAGVPAVVAPGDAQALAVVEAEGSRVGAPLYRAGIEFPFEVRHRTDGGFGIEIDTRTPRFECRDLRAPVAGLHQGENAAVASTLFDLFLADLGLPPDPGALKRGLASVRIPGRAEKVGEQPTLILDVAHNVLAVRATLEAVTGFYPFERLATLAGFSADKDWAGALSLLAARASALFLTTAGGPRAADPGELAEVARKAGARNVSIRPVLEDAVDALLEACGPDDLALITGSFYVAGRACKHLGVDVA